MNKLVAILIAGIAVLLPFVGEQLDSGNFCTIAIMIIVGVVVVGLSLCRRNLNMDVSRTDVALLLFTLYIVVCDVFSSGLYLNRLFLYIFLLFLYISARINHTPIIRIFPYGIIIMGVTQLVVAYLQLADVIPSLHNAFPCTGSFLNPAPLGAVTALAIVTGVTLMAKKQGLKRYLMILSITFMTPILIYADSRDSWLACGVSIVFFLLKQWNIKRIWKTIAVIGCLLLIAVPLYQYKQASADARVLIWKICGNIAQENPIVGQGTDAVKSNYMLHQAEYFAQGGSNEEKLLAAYNNHAFNEPLDIVCSYGIIGLALLCAVLAMYFHETRFKGSMPAVVLCLVVFAMFSYPLENTSLLTVAIISLACVPSKMYTISVSQRAKMIGASVMAVLVMFFGYRLYFHEKTNKAIDEFHWDRSKAVFLADNFNKFDKEPLLVARYGLVLKESGNYDKAIAVLKRMCELRPSPDVFYDLGECYEKCELNEEAEKCYHLVADMLPAFITPQYRLLRLYQQTGNTSKAQKTAEYMLAMPLKKETEESQRMKTVAKDFLLTLKAHRQ